MTLRFNSILRRGSSMTPNRRDGIINAALQEALKSAREAGLNNVVARSLHAGDLPPTSTTERRWIETTATTTDVFVTAAIGDGTNINDDTVIAIYGCQYKFIEQRDGNGDKMAWEPPVTAVRFVVGGTRVAEWDLYTAFTPTGGRGATSSTTGDFGVWQDYPECIGESFILVKPRTSLLLQYYEITGGTGTDFSLQYLGIVVEATGSGDGLNP